MSNPQPEPEHTEPSEEELRQLLDARELSIRPEQNADRENIRFGMELHELHAAAHAPAAFLRPERTRETPVRSSRGPLPVF